MSLFDITLAGSPVTLVSLPTSPGFRSVQFSPFDAVGIVQSVFTGQTQVQKWPGADLLSGVMTLPTLSKTQANDWVSFLMQCRGMANGFQIGDPLRTAPTGVGTGIPFADNTQNGGNPAGSEWLGTKGWTPSVTGILKRGDCFALNWRLYYCLDDVNSDGSGNALINIYPSLRETVTQDGTSNGFQNAGGSLTLTATSPIGGQGFWAMWSDFFLVPGVGLPADAVIQGIYPVVDLSAGTVSGDPPPSIHWGPNIRAGDAISPGGTGTMTTPAVPFSSSVCYAPSVGTSLSALNGQEIYIQVYETLEGTWSSNINVSGIAYAIYYTSATPSTDATLAPPFAVPAGQGLAWAMPSSATTGQISSPKAGGSVAATPAVLNGQIGVRNPTGLFRLASNKRDWSADFTRRSSISIPIQEYR